MKKRLLIVGILLAIGHHAPLQSSADPASQPAQTWWGRITQVIAPVTRFLQQRWQNLFSAPVQSVPQPTRPVPQSTTVSANLQPPSQTTQATSSQESVLQRRIRQIIPATSTKTDQLITGAPTAGSSSTAPFSAPAKATQEDLLEKMNTAIWKNDYRQVQQLLNDGVDPNGRRDKGDSPLEMALFWDKPAIAPLLLDRGADPNSKTKNGTSLIDTAVKERNLAFFRLLKEKGAKVTPAVAIDALRYYTRPGETDNLQQWLEAGLDPNGQSITGESLLEHALYWFQPDVDVIRLLLKYGAQPDGVLKKLVKYILFSYESSAEKKLKLLFDAGLNPNSTVDSIPLLSYSLVYIDENSHSVQRYSVQHLVSLLLAAGANPNSTSPEGVSALEYVSASDMGQTIVQKLLDSGARITEKVFVQAVSNGCSAVVVAALKKGLSPNYYDTSAQQPVLDIALDAKKRNVADYLLKNGAQPTQQSLLYALRAEMPVDFVEKLLDAGANPNVMFPDNGPMGKVTAFEYALRDNQLDVAILLLDKGASLPATDANGQSWIQYAYKFDSKELMEALIKRGFSLDAQDDKGQTVLLQAVVSRKREWVEWLIEYGADPTIEGEYGNAFDLAENNPQLLAILKRSKYSQKEGQKERYTPRLAAAYQAAGRTRNISEQVTPAEQYHEASGRTTSEVYREIFQEEILKKYGTQLLEENRINILQLLNRERTYWKTHYVFYHAQNAAHRIAQDFWQQILALIQLGDVPDFIVPPSGS